MPGTQRAAYIDLLGLQWVRGGFSREQAHLAVRGVEESDIDQVIDEKFEEVKPNWFCNARLESERESQRKRTTAAKENGKKGGRPKTQQTTQSKPKLKPQPNPQEKLSVSDSVSVSNNTLSLSVGPKASLQSDWLEHIPEKYRTENLVEAVEVWEQTRKNPDGELIGLDGVVLRMEMKAIGDVPPDEMAQIISKAAAQGWKGLRQLEKVRDGPRKAKRSVGDIVADEMRKQNAAG